MGGLGGDSENTRVEFEDFDSCFSDPINGAEVPRIM